MSGLPARAGSAPWEPGSEHGWVEERPWPGEFGRLPRGVLGKAQGQAGTSWRVREPRGETGLHPEGTGQTVGGRRGTDGVSSENKGNHSHHGGENGRKGQGRGRAVAWVRRKGGKQGETPSQTGTAHPVRPGSSVAGGTLSGPR